MRRSSAAQGKTTRLQLRFGGFSRRIVGREHRRQRRRDGGLHWAPRLRRRGEERSAWEEWLDDDVIVPTEFKNRLTTAGTPAPVLTGC
jgi:hypothetical protein